MRHDHSAYAFDDDPYTLTRRNRWPLPQLPLGPWLPGCEAAALQSSRPQNGARALPSTASSAGGCPGRAPRPTLSPTNAKPKLGRAPCPPLQAARVGVPRARALSYPEPCKSKL